MDARIALDLHPAAQNGSRIRRLLQSPVRPTLHADGRRRAAAAVSLIIPSFFNSRLKAGALRLVLDRVARARSISEVILVISPGDPPPARNLRALCAGKLFRVARATSNQVANSRNIGAAAATGELLLFWDDDMLCADWAIIDAIVAELKSGRCDCALFPRRHYVRFPNLYRPAALSATVNAWKADPEQSHPAILNPLVEGCEYRTMLLCMPGCFMLIDRRKYHEIGGFSEDYQGWGFEDAHFALRAAEQLKVLNLFRKAPPLLHIDHPVSPYKSEEYRENYNRFSKGATAMDFDSFCARILTGRDWKRSLRVGSRASRFMRPLRHIARKLKLRLETPPLSQNYSALVERRLLASCSAIPEFILLHGSRAWGGAAPADSDYDFLFLFADGRLQDYFSHEARGVRVEFEYSDLNKFEDIPVRPSYYGLAGVLEFGKIARAQPLFDPGATWRNWRRALVERCSEEAILFWSVLAVGILLSHEKYGAYSKRFLGAFEKIIQACPAPECPLLARPQDDLNTFAAALAGRLDRERPCWRMDLKRGQKVFENQTPEVWTGLHWLLKK